MLSPSVLGQALLTPGVCSGVEVVHAPPLGQTFRLAFKMLAPPGAEGYIFAQSLIGDTARNVASLFVRGDGSGLDFGYRVSGGAAVVSWATAARVPPGTAPGPFPVLADNLLHTLELLVDGRAGHLRASLAIDGNVLGAQALSGGIDGCSFEPGTCSTYVLQDSGSGPKTKPQLDGCMFEATTTVTV